MVGEGVMIGPSRDISPPITWASCSISCAFCCGTRTAQHIIVLFFSCKVQLNLIQPKKKKKRVQLKYDIKANYNIEYRPT